MKIWVLAENTAKDKRWEAEHGLSLYIEACGHKILFDTGQSELFLRNAKRFSIDLKEVDIVVISHGHYDHGGGLSAFLKINQNAKVYIRKAAFDPHYSLRETGYHEIGLRPELLKSNRIIFTERKAQIAPGITLFSGVEQVFPVNRANQRLYMEKDGKRKQDDFVHEQNMLIEEKGNTVLFAGCAHSGILNIMRSAPVHFETVVGGFHFLSKQNEYRMTKTELLAIAEECRKLPVQYWTGHCTGEEAFAVLHAVLKERIQSIAAGMCFVVGEG